MKKILFFVPGRAGIYNMLVCGPLSKYASLCVAPSNITSLQENLIPDCPQLVFIGTVRRTTIEPALLARLVKAVNPMASVILVSASEQPKHAPLDGFVLVSGAYYREIEGLADLVMAK